MPKAGVSGSGFTRRAESCWTRRAITSSKPGSWKSGKDRSLQGAAFDAFQRQYFLHQTLFEDVAVIEDSDPLTQ